MIVHPLREPVDTGDDLVVAGEGVVADPASSAANAAAPPPRTIVAAIAALVRVVLSFMVRPPVEGGIARSYGADGAGGV